MPPLHIKHRPRGLKAFYGNWDTVTALGALLEKPQEDVPHAFLFTGPSGCGKTTLARITANGLGCNSGDFKEIDSADFRGIDTIREIRRQSNYKPLNGACKVYLLDEVHQLSKDAQNALLKALEDTPEHVYYILATTEPQKLIRTLVNRCTNFTVGPLPLARLVRLLRQTAETEGKEIPSDIIDKIAMGCQGSPRAALVMLDRVIELAPEDMARINIEALAEEEDEEVISLCRAIIKKRPWPEVAQILQGLRDKDPENVRRAILGYYTTVLMGENALLGFMVMDCFREPFYDSGYPGLVFATYEALSEALEYGERG
jgi:DNA polymerase-3 subunit gamma/tau